MITRRGVRPTLLAPLWDRAGFALGAVTAAIGPEAAMACTAAIETEIDRHYDQQLQELGDEDPELTDAIRDFQAEERSEEHTSELQSLMRISYAVFCLKKKTRNILSTHDTTI